MSRLAGVVLVLWSAAAAATPDGRVVRVERSGGRVAVAPRLCEIRGDGGTCVGEPPQTGQTVVLLDEQHAVAELQVIETTSVMTGCPNLWRIKTRVLRGVVAGTDRIGVIDAGLNVGRAHVLEKSRNPVAPSGQSGDEVWRAIDRDGDGTADILLTRYTCDPSSKPVPGGSTFCIDVWARSGAKLVRTTQLNFAQCNI